MISWVSSWFWDVNGTDPNALNTESETFTTYPARNMPFSMTHKGPYTRLKDVSIQAQIEQRLASLRKTTVPPRPVHFPTRHPVLEQILRDIPRIE